MYMYGCPPETITTLLIGYTPIQNKKLKKESSASGAKPREVAKYGLGPRADRIV